MGTPLGVFRSHQSLRDYYVAPRYDVKEETVNCFSSASFLLHNVIEKQKWLYLHLDCFSGSLALTMLFMLPQQKGFLWKNEGLVYSTKEVGQLPQKKTGRRIVLKVAFSQMKVEQKGNSAMQKTSKRWWGRQMRPRRRVTESEAKQKGTDRSHDAERCFSVNTHPKTEGLLHRSVA